ncbi:hypothetical protein KGF54_004716 [Candida jiufengensis]|uniref:uncharacterized protein n=1 Tax=Candida jiufengensis TaxID=497108 RepID=UPI002224320B|nr:uncharacterized protein KGF54_004716 [Candida jiufengensis]KAI5951642.1 hypothetical protein KGF54_004716 [Candida jiufengensis]
MSSSTSTTNNNNTSHTTLLTQAKTNQYEDLKKSQQYSKLLQSLLKQFIASNSNSSPNSNLLDKFQTILQLDQNIDNQLNNDISFNFYELIKIKKKLEKFIKNCETEINKVNQTKVINGDHEIDDFNLQKRCEFIDQDLRVLEYTLKLIDEQRSSSGNRVTENTSTYR